jgi:hypothetical protein
VQATAQSGQRELHLLAVLPWLRHTARQLAREAGKSWEDAEDTNHGA